MSTYTSLKNLSPSQKKAIALWLKNSKTYLQFLKINSKDDGLVNFKLNKIQTDYHEKKSKRDIILKPRQVGFSTYNIGDLYVKTVTNSGQRTGIVAQTRQDADNLFAIVKRFYESTPEIFRPRVRYDTKRQMTFPDLNSMIVAFPATKNVGRSWTFNNLLCSEVAFWNYPDESMTSLFNSVTPEGIIRIESTPYGIGNWFHKQYLGSKDKTSLFNPIFYPYTFHEEYTEEWKQAKLAEMNGDMRKFQQEYPADDVSCFLRLVGMPVFESELLKIKGKMKGIDPKSEFVVAVDPSEGIPGQDLYGITVFNRDGTESFSEGGYLPVDKLGERSVEVAKEYNDADLVIERNNHGHAVITTIINQIGYTKLWKDQDGKAGFQTNVKSKNLIINKFKDSLRDGSITLTSRDLVDEMQVFEYKENGAAAAAQGYHDDRLMSAMIAWHVATAPKKEFGTIII